MRFFFVRMVRDMGFRLFYKNLYDAMRLCFLRIFDELAPKVSRVELALNQAVMKTLAEESAVWERSKIETRMRGERVAWLQGLSSDWSLRERTRWREGIPDLPEWKKRVGRKRTWSKTKSKPGKNQRKKMKLAVRSKENVTVKVAACVPGDPGVDLPGQGPAQVVSGVVGETPDPDKGEGGVGDVVPEEGVADAVNRRARMTPVRRNQGGVRSARSDAWRFRTYDELIEEKAEIAFPDDLEFSFEIPKEIEDIEV